MPPYPITHKLVEFAIAFAVVIALPWIMWRDRRGKKHRRRDKD